MVEISDVSVECHLLYMLPLCFTDILWFDVRYGVSCTTLSHTLESIGSSEIGHNYWLLHDLRS